MKGRVEETDVQVLHDNGCNGVVVKYDIVCGTAKCENSAKCENAAKCEKQSTLNVKIPLNVKNLR